MITSCAVAKAELKCSGTTAICIHGGANLTLKRFVFNANQRDPIRHRDVMPTPAASGAVDSFVVVTAFKVIYIHKVMYALRNAISGSESGLSS